MPRKTLALISGLVLVTVVLFIVAVRTNKQASQIPPTQVPVAQQPTTPAHSVLSLSPNPITVAPGQQGSVDVNIDTSDNAVTAVQLEIAYDPNIIGDVQVKSGALFTKPVVLINKNDPKTGRFTYAYGISPNSPTVKGTGSVATITFTAKSVAGKQAQLALLPTTLVTARGVASSVLKQATGTMVVIGTAAAANTGTGPAVKQPAKTTGY
jgi:hypothetical protein